MSQVHLTILQQALMALENLQALNKNDMKLIHTIDCPELLGTCAVQLQKLAKELEPYRTHDIVGTNTSIGWIAGVKKNRRLRTIEQYKIANDNGTNWMTAEEFNNALNQQRVTNAVTNR